MRSYLNPKVFICPNCHKVISVRRKIRHGSVCIGKKQRKEQRKEEKQEIKKIMGEEKNINKKKNITGE